MITLYNAASEDGFLARENGDEDFIPDDAFDEFLAFCKKYDVVVIGRKTFEAIQKYPREMVRAFERLNVKRVVLSQNPAFQPGEAYEVRSSILDVPGLGEKVVISSGPTVNTAAIQIGIVDMIFVNTVPVKIQKGIPLLFGDVKLVEKASETLPSGRILKKYDLVRA